MAKPLLVPLIMISFQKLVLNNQMFWVSRNIIFDRFVCGDMRRHRQTISQVCEGMQLSKYNLDILPGLNEYDFENLFLAYGKIFGDDDSYKKAKKNPKDKKNY